MLKKRNVNFTNEILTKGGISNETVLSATVSWLQSLSIILGFLHTINTFLTVFGVILINPRRMYFSFLK